MGRSCSKHGSDDIQQFWLNNLKEKYHLEDLEIDERMYKMDLKRKRVGGCRLVSSFS
jgi:hypothetical protein